MGSDGSSSVPGPWGEMETGGQSGDALDEDHGKMSALFLHSSGFLGIRNITTLKKMPHYHIKPNGKIEFLSQGDGEYVR